MSVMYYTKQTPDLLASREISIHLHLKPHFRSADFQCLIVSLEISAGSLCDYRIFLTWYRCSRNQAIVHLTRVNEEFTQRIFAFEGLIEMK